MKRLIGYTAALCLLAMMVGCGGVTSTGTLAYVSNSKGTGFTVFTVNTDGTLTKSSISPQNTQLPPKVLQFSPNGKWAYFLDSTGNTIYGYTRAGNGDLQTQIGPGVPVGGVGAASALVISANSQYLYVALPNDVGGGDVASFLINSNDGTLQNVSTITLGYAIQQLVISSNVLYGLSPSQAAIVSMTLNTSTGTITSAGNVHVGTTPQYMILSANGQYMYVLDQTATHPIYNSNLVQIGVSPNIYGFNTTGTGITATNAMPNSPFTENPDAVTGTSVSNPVTGVTSNDSRFLFIANRGTTNISVFTISAGTGVPVEVKGTTTVVNSIPISSASPFTCGVGCTNPSFAAVSNENNALYLLDPTAGSAVAGNTALKTGAIFQFAIDQNTGRVRALNPASVIPDGPSPTWITIR